MIIIPNHCKNHPASKKTHHTWKKKRGNDVNLTHQLETLKKTSHPVALKKWVLSHVFQAHINSINGGVHLPKVDFATPIQSDRT